MKHELVDQIRERMKGEATQKLLEIWREHDSDEWSGEAFEAIRRILTSRGVVLPPQKQAEEGPEPFMARQERTTRAFLMKSGTSINIPAVCACCNRQTTDEFERIEHSETTGSQVITRSIQIPMCSDCQDHNNSWDFFSWSIYLSPLFFFVLGVLVNQYLFLMMIGGPVLGIPLRTVLGI